MKFKDYIKESLDTKGGIRPVFPPFRKYLYESLFHRQPNFPGELDSLGFSMNFKINSEELNKDIINLLTSYSKKKFNHIEDGIYDVEIEYNKPFKSFALERMNKISFWASGISLDIKISKDGNLVFHILGFFSQDATPRLIWEIGKTSPGWPTGYLQRSWNEPRSQDEISIRQIPHKEFKNGDIFTKVKILRLINDEMNQYKQKQPEQIVNDAPSLYKYTKDPTVRNKLSHYYMADKFGLFEKE